MLVRFAFLAVSAALTAAVAVSAAHAQSDEGDGFAVGPETGIAIITNPGTDVISTPGINPGADYRSYAEDMRLFVIRIAAFARRYNPDFGVIAENALDLTEKTDPIDEYLSAPARGFMRAIDAFLVTGLELGFPDEVSQDDEGVLGELLDDGPSDRLRRLQMASDEGVRSLLLDVTEDPVIVQAGRSQAAAMYDAPYYAAPDVMARLSRLAETPTRPFDENPDNVLTFDAVRNYAMLTNSAPLGRMDEFALDMQGTNYDLLIVPPFHGRLALSRQAVNTMQYKKTGARRLVYARINIGYAPSYAYYWGDDWREGRPRFIGPPQRDDPDLYRAIFWDPDWQKIFTGDTQSYIYGLVAQGYDGVVLTGLDAHHFFQAGGVEE
ncbi:MAG: hypothetical protein ACYYKD_08005 [Rhodospirillales bacterium]